MMSRSIHVLVCDDDPLLVEIVAYRLAADGHRISICADGLDALSILRSGPVDVVILDAMMPGLDGFQVLAEIRGDRSFDSLPVIMLSARSREFDVVSALRMGANDYIVKPFIPDELSIRLARLVRQSQLDTMAA
jgi:DNA-binding response OmpR family regulator